MSFNDLSLQLAPSRFLLAKYLHSFNITQSYVMRRNINFSTFLKLSLISFNPGVPDP